MQLKGAKLLSDIDQQQGGYRANMRINLTKEAEI